MAYLHVIISISVYLSVVFPRDDIPSTNLEDFFRRLKTDEENNDIIMCTSIPKGPIVSVTETEIQPILGGKVDFYRNWDY